MRGKGGTAQGSGALGTVMQRAGMQRVVMQRVGTRRVGTRRGGGIRRGACPSGCGGMCYEMLIGRRVFTGRNIKDLFKKVEDGNYSLPTHLSKEVVSC